MSNRNMDQHTYNIRECAVLEKEYMIMKVKKEKFSNNTRISFR